ncbi:MULTISPECIES: NADPH-dependent FMN reductase [Chryseobacterium]|uniref:Chromate reductase n=1 Tax=Chryseobacterium camelliae TaxID=1265445 RepID=A0ABU0TK70_9FLAO|nr:MULTISPECIES: NADPH-dependent FMN reductase [Chryseobacterium]MDT3408712.1 chromate reductase [Pseudacidovorax intermedius]MDQ1097435.1 chromate reductase [Chryseobacterium camelliae]MDQ1101363.1 chromate reductase [Chryseobacterium sp. SORGH_AS_1048]MDR6084808.1 chromate reductase [Chryseobacterium sp. SORGH_AS_0909]MDR6129155.1 chromate reductase [Chryseobacterium sp. SORGH_AS_1175]
MSSGTKILIVIGSASRNSSNLKLMEQILEKTGNTDFLMYSDLSVLPHFDTALTDDHTPEEVLTIREDINRSAGIIFSTPEYIFSIPAGLKNLLEWCVSTTVFSEKPVAVITASANGEKGHEELLLILKTLGAITDNKHQALIKGIKGKFDINGSLETDTFAKVSKLVTDFIASVS